MPTKPPQKNIHVVHKLIYKTRMQCVELWFMVTVSGKHTFQDKIKIEITLHTTTLSNKLVALYNSLDDRVI